MRCGWMLATLGSVVVACGEAPPAPDPKIRIDERAGTFRGVGLGDPASEARNVFGPPTPYSQREGVAPVGDSYAEIGGPTSLSPGRGCRTEGDANTLRYRGVTFAGCRGRLQDLLISATGAHTRTGVTVGTSTLQDAKEAYPGLRCEMANEGTEYVSYPYCAGKVAPDRWAWFGRDPISSITLADRPIG